MDRPNILLITSDQHQPRAIGSLNPTVRTPALDRLSARGVTFERAYCPNPTCTPTRASIITGQYPSRHGAYTLGTRLDPASPTVGRELAAAGYRTSLVGKAHFQPLRTSPECESIESYPLLRDLEYWRTFNDRQTPWYGFDRVEITRNHTDEGHAGQHYGLWLEEKGLKNWREFFQVRNDGVRDTPRDGARAPERRNGPGYGWRESTRWDLPEELHYSHWTAERTIAAMSAAREQGRPFFVWSSYHDPHPPYAVPEPWASMYDPATLEPGRLTPGEMEHMPPPHRMTIDPDADFSEFNVDRFGNHGYHPHVPVSRQELREALACYYGMISLMDACIGRTLDALEQMGQADNTLVVFTSDHGHFIGEHGLVAKGPFHYEDLIRVPMIASFPGRLPAGMRSDAVQSLVDLAPTFMQAAGFGVPRWMQGLGQLPAWTSGGSARDHALVENHHQDSSAVHLRTLVTQRYKLTVYRNRDWGELFDLHDDPGEVHNRFNDPEYGSVREMMLRKLIDADLDREPAPMPRIGGA
jgi:arylsulfatase A-like enzyme